VAFAHLFEHLMFKSTKNMKSEMMDRLTEDVGGSNGASTNDDVTIYNEVVPSNYLETLIWAEADRLAGLNVDEANFKSERDVVKEEYRESVLTPPYGRFDFLLQQKSFLQHPYKRPNNRKH
jgi:zinc protease